LIFRLLLFNLGFTRCGGACDGRLLNDQSVALQHGNNAEEADLIGKNAL